MSKKLSVTEDGFNLLVRLGFKIEFTATPFWIAGPGQQVQKWEPVPLTEHQEIDYKAIKKALRKIGEYSDSHYYTLRVAPEEEQLAREKLRRIRRCTRKVNVHGSGVNR